MSMKRRRTKPTRLSIGTISSGTLRPEDIFPELDYVARSIRMTRADRRDWQRLAKFFYALPTDCQTDDDVETLVEAYDLLEGYCPDYCYLGALEGDGADIGVWPVSEVLQGDYYADEVPRIALGDDPPRAKGARYYIAVSDHGNATLYRRAGNRWVEVWGVV